MKLPVAFIATVIALTAICNAQNHQLTKQEAETIVQGLKLQKGEITLQGGLAKLNIPEGFRYLNPEDAETVLVKLWGNPPSTKPLGMILPADVSPLSQDSWAVTISYTEDGYVKDDDAGKINYDDLMKTMKQAVHESNEERTKNGYKAIELVGWAAPPRYDAATHKMYWAKELKFAGVDENTLNYNIRILGRRGVLVLNAIAGMDQLNEIEKQAPQILGMVNFNDGNRYADFDPKVDKVATYGIAALVAGGIAAKAGLFKLIWVFILGAKKLIIVAIAAVSTWLKKIFGKRKTTGELNSGN